MQTMKLKIHPLIVFSTAVNHNYSDSNRNKNRNKKSGSKSTNHKLTHTTSDSLDGSRQQKASTIGQGLESA